MCNMVNTGQGKLSQESSSAFTRILPGIHRGHAHGPQLSAVSSLPAQVMLQDYLAQFSASILATPETVHEMYPFP